MATKKDEIIEQIRQDIKLVVMQDLMRQLTRKCFDRCVASPSASFSKQEQACLSRCAARFLEATQIVGKTYITIAQKDKDTA